MDILKNALLNKEKAAIVHLAHSAMSTVYEYFNWKDVDDLSPA